MKAAIEQDNLTREITVRVVNGPVMNVTRPWHRRTREIGVERVDIRVHNGMISWIKVSGGLKLKSGGTSDNVGDSVTWYGAQGDQVLPEWVRTVVDESVSGRATEWTWDEIPA